MNIPGQTEILPVTGLLIAADAVAIAITKITAVASVLDILTCSLHYLIFDAEKYEEV